MGCMKQIKDYSTYSKIRDLAVRMAKTDGMMVIYKNADGSYNFAPIGFEKGIIVEYISGK